MTFNELHLQLSGEKVSKLHTRQLGNWGRSGLPLKQGFHIPCPILTEIVYKQRGWHQAL